MEQGTKKDLLSLTQRLLAEKAILIDTIKSYVLTQRTLKNESKYKNTTSPYNDNRSVMMNDMVREKII